MKNHPLADHTPARKTGAERLHLDGRPLDATVLDFWRWACSDLLSNATRGMLAEYIVGRALDCVSGVRTEWDAADLLTCDGFRIEIKTSAYLQSWHQKKLSSITFSIPPTLAWDPKTNTWETEKKRQADVYVFCLLAHRDKETVDPLNLDQWRFFVLPTATLTREVPEQKTISLAALRKLGPAECGYDGLAQAVRAAVTG